MAACASLPLGLSNMLFPTFVSVCPCKDVEKKTHQLSVVGKPWEQVERGRPKFQPLTSFDFGESVPWYGISRRFGVKKFHTTASCVFFRPPKFHDSLPLCLSKTAISDPCVCVLLQGCRNEGTPPQCRGKNGKE